MVSISHLLMRCLHNRHPQAALKIVTHCCESAPALVSGQLLGIDVDGVLEITNCFPSAADQQEGMCCFLSEYCLHALRISCNLR